MILLACRHTRMFFAAVQVVSAFPDTCVEIWQMNGTDSSGELLTSQYLDLSNVVHTFPASIGQDHTGLKINSSRPIGVYSGHSCAFVPDEPVKVHYCDHMVEQIPPVSELGLTHIAVPIVGRDSKAG